MYKPFYFLAVFPSIILCATFNFQLYNMSFNYPDAWIIQSRNNTSVQFNIGSNRILYAEFYPDGKPTAYMMAKTKYMDSAYLNFNIFSSGGFTMANHWGLWFTCTQADKQTFDNFSMCCWYVRIPKYNQVLCWQYINMEKPTSSWADDVSKIQTLFTTVNCQSDNIPNRNLASNTHVSLKSPVKIMYSNNLKVTDNAAVTDIYLEDNYDNIFESYQIGGAYNDTGKINTRTYFNLMKTMSIAHDTALFGSDSFKIITDTIYSDTAAVLYYKYGGRTRHDFVWCRYIYIYNDNKIIGQISFGNILQTVEYYIDYNNYMLSNIFFIPSNHVIQSPFNKKYESSINRNKIKNYSSIYDLKGRKIFIENKFKQPLSSNYYIIKNQQIIIHNKIK